MAITMTMQFPATAAQYDEVNKKIGMPESVPDGLLCHTSAVLGDEIRVVDVWESEDAFNAFNNATLMPAVLEVMDIPEGAAPQPPVIQELYNVFTA